MISRIELLVKKRKEEVKFVTSVIYVNECGFQVQSLFEVNVINGNIMGIMFV